MDFGTRSSEGSFGSSSSSSSSSSGDLEIGSSLSDEEDEQEGQEGKGQGRDGGGDGGGDVKWDDILPFLRHYGRQREGDEAGKPGSGPINPTKEQEKQRPAWVNDEQHRVKRLLAGLLRLDPARRMGMIEAGRVVGCG